jgi:rhamnosyltransferase
MSKPLSKFITVFIPTYNGDKYLHESIDSIFNQKLPKGYQLELMITDSGSTDKTVAIIEEYKDRIVFNKIPNSEYGHGKTRQRAAEHAKGDYIIFLSQDATPQSERWLINMIEPFFLSDKVGCVFGRQVPRPFSVPTIKREVSSVFGSIGAPDSIILHRNKSLVDGTITNQLNTFFSDVNSAIRKDLVNEVPFRDVKYAEDQALAEDMQSAGYLKAYSPIGVVWHSNEYTAKEYYHRKFDEYIGLQESTNTQLNKSLKSLLGGWIHPTIDDIKFALRDREYNRRARIKFIMAVPLYNFYLQLGKYRAIKYIDNPKMRAKISLEERSKN